MPKMLDLVIATFSFLCVFSGMLYVCVYLLGVFIDTPFIHMLMSHNVILNSLYIGV